MTAIYLLLALLPKDHCLLGGLTAVLALTPIRVNAIWHHCHMIRLLGKWNGISITSITSNCLITSGLLSTMCTWTHLKDRNTVWRQVGSVLHVLVSVSMRAISACTYITSKSRRVLWKIEYCETNSVRKVKFVVIQNIAERIQCAKV